MAQVQFCLTDGSGFDLMRTLRDTHGLRGIALTGYGMEADMRQAQDAGFVQHLTKPVEFAQLKAALAQVAAAKELQAERSCGFV